MSPFVSSKYFNNYCYILSLYIHQFDDLWWIFDVRGFIIYVWIVWHLQYYCVPLAEYAHEIAWDPMSRGLQNGHLERCMVLAMKQVCSSADFGHLWSLSLAFTASLKLWRFWGEAMISEVSKHVQKMEFTKVAKLPCWNAFSSFGYVPTCSNMEILCLELTLWFTVERPFS